MNRGLYIAGTGMLSMRTKMDVITNNLANSDTIGYRTDGMITRSFENMMINRLNEKNPGVGAAVGPLGMGTHIDESFTVFDQGPMEFTEENTDLAIAGEGFFVVETPQGERYTRAGNFTMNPDGTLVNPDGFFLLDTEGEHITLEGKDFDVDEKGNVIQNGEVVTTINVVTFENVDNLVKQGANLFAGDGAQPSENYSVRQGFIEGSNIELAREVTEMLMTNRAFEANQRMVRMIDESLGRAVNDIAKF